MLEPGSTQAVAAVDWAAKAAPEVMAAVVVTAAADYTVKLGEMEARLAMVPTVERPVAAEPAVRSA